MSITFETLITHNKRWSALLVLGLLLFIGILTGGFQILIGDDYSERAILNNFGNGLLIGAVATLFGSVFSYLLGGKLVALISNARKIDSFQDKVLYNATEEMAIAAGIPMPQIYVIFDDSPNAFATGRDPNHAIVGITTGLRKKLNRDELQAVIAHEIAHIKNYDTLLMMMVGVFAGIVVLLADFFWRRLLDEMKITAVSGKSKVKLPWYKHLGFIIVAILCGALLSWIAPIFARVLQLAVSREREYLADASAVQLCRNPRALVSALKKIASDPLPLKCDNRATEHMFIINPDPKRKMISFNEDTIWSTHPPVLKRIARINKLIGEYESQTAPAPAPV